MTTTETWLLAMGIIFALPYLLWRLGRTDYIAPLVVVQMLCGIALGPGVLGKAYPDYYDFVFTGEVTKSINGLALWAVMLYVMIAGIELDARKAWASRRESGITAALALGVPMALGALCAWGLSTFPGWIGEQGQRWQFVLGVGMACAVTALPILLLLMEKLDVLRAPIGQRLLRYASLDDIAIWAVLALVLMDWQRIGRQLVFFLVFAAACWLFRKLMPKLPVRDRWAVGLIWLIACALGADWSGLHFMVGAFLAGVMMDSDWFDQEHTDQLRHHLLLILMPVYFLSTGLKTSFDVGGASVVLVAAVLLAASTLGKLAGVHLAGKLLGWNKGEASMIGWLLQTKGLIMIVFANVLLDQHLITSATFTALLLLAIGSTMLTVPMVAPKLRRFAAESRAP